MVGDLGGKLEHYTVKTICYNKNQTILQNSKNPVKKSKL